MEGHPAEHPSSSSAIFEQVLNSNTFVDKTGLMLEVFQDIAQHMLLCTAPRRFGKTVNLQMMKQFLELEVDEKGKEKTAVLEEKYNYKVLNSPRIKLKVMQKKEFVKTHFGKYSIIELNFVCAEPIESKSDAVDVCRAALSRAFKEHSYLYEFELSQLKEYEKKDCEQWCDKFACEKILDKNVRRSLADLAVYLNKFHNKTVFLLVDEYDSIISNALYNIKNAEELENTASFPIQVIGYALKSERQMFRGAYITGILDVGGVGFPNLLGDVLRKQFGTKNLCQDFYGFTENEVDTLFNLFGVEEGLKEKAKAKYNGYFNGDKKPLYNPHSVVQFLSNLGDLGEGALENYWQQSGYIQNLYHLFQEVNVRMLLDKHLQGVIDFEFKLKPFQLSDLKSLHNILTNPNLTCDDEIVVRFLTSLGYLTYSFDDHKLKIPNGELIDEVTKIFF